MIHTRNAANARLTAPVPIITKGGIDAIIRNPDTQVSPMSSRKMNRKTISVFLALFASTGVSAQAADKPHPVAAVHYALFVRLEAKPGKEQALADFLDAGLAMADRETTTPIWFALRLSPTTFGIFDAFASDQDRQAHLAGPIAQALGAHAAELLAKDPTIERIDVLGLKNQLAKP